MKIPSVMEDFIVDDMTPKQVQHVKPVLPGKATGRVSEIYAQIRTDFQLVPPLTLFSPSPELLGGVWSLWREAQFAEGNVPRAFTEAVAAAVSSINTCPYCVDAHSGMLHASSDHDVVNGIVDNKAGLIKDERMRNLVNWAKSTLTPDAEVIKAPPFHVDDAPEILGTAFIYHFVNRMVNIFLPESPLPVPTGIKTLRKSATRMFGATVAKNIVARKVTPGESLRFVPEVRLPEEFFWAAGNRSLASALAGLNKIIEEAGQKTLAEETRDAVISALASWNGEDMGLSRCWVDPMINKTSVSHRAETRLTLLTALAPHQVDSKIISEFRGRKPDDASLLNATAWSSFAAARRVASWLAN